jgi:simple sugar transport system permease protein
VTSPTTAPLRRALASPVLLAVLAALVIGALVLLGSGADPLQAYAAIATGAFGPENWSSTVAMAVPVIGMALAVAVPLRAGVVNLGGEGQIVAGGITSVVVASALPLPAPLSLVVSLAAGALAGGLVAAVPAVLENRLGVPLLISSLLLSYPVVGVASYLVRFPLRDPSTGLPQTHRLPDAYRLPDLGAVGVSALVVLALVAVVVAVDRGTPAGFEIRLTGLNRRFTTYGGLDVPRLVTRVMVAGGAIAGLVGGMVVAAFPYRYVDGALTVPGYTWTGLLAALLARAHPLGTAVAGLLFAALEIGGFGMERTTEVPRELSSVLQAVVIILLAAGLALTARRGRRREG